MITQEHLKQILDYKPDTGLFTRLVTTSSRAKAGHIAGHLSNLGYLRISIGGVHYLSHRLAYLFMTGEWPESEVDHINGVPVDNRWCNLRAATHAENMRNRARQRNNKSGHKGVHWSRVGRKWTSQITLLGIVTHLGYFDSIEEASDAYDKASRELHGEFARAA